MQIDKNSELPAIMGGTQVKTDAYGTGIRYGEEELNLLREVIDQGTCFYAQGKKVYEMENKIKQLTGSKYAIATSSGTASIHTALIAAGISPDDEVIVTPITDMGSIAPILWQGAVPIFADLDPNSYNIDPKSVESLITDKSRAILAVHLWGNSCDLNSYKAICKKHNLFLIEDCAQAWGCEYENKQIGSFGDIGCFSLNEFKHVSCGDGGVVVTDDESLAKRLRIATDKCYSRDLNVTNRTPYFLANNYRLTELQAAVALAQLNKLKDIVAKRRAYAEKLNESLAAIDGLLLPKPTSKCNPSWWFYMFRVDPKIIGIDADRFAEALSAEGVPAGAHYIGKCVYEYPIFVNHSVFERGSHPFSRIQYGKGMCPEAESILETSIMLQVNETFNKKDLDDTIKAIIKISKWFSENKN